MAREIRRLTYEELTPELRGALASKVERLGYLGEFFAVCGHQPEALLAFNEFTEALKRALPAELTEVVALTAASALGNDYERCQHEQLSVRLGLSREWIAAATGHGDTGALSEQARCARELVLTLLAHHGHEASAEVSGAVAVLGEQAAVGVLLQAGRYAAHALVSNALAFAAPVPSVFGEAKRAVPR
jgi:alkylhydroperoxidase family enzyme